jgi:hypothetical protein
VGADRLVDRAIQRFPILGKVDELAAPVPEEPDLLRKTVNNMGGTEWIDKIAEQAKRLEPNPPRSSGPQTRGH